MSRAVVILVFFFCLGIAGLPSGRAQSAAGDGQQFNLRDLSNTIPEETDRVHNLAEHQQLPHTQIERDSGPPYDKMFYRVGIGRRIEPRAGPISATIPDVLRGGFRYNLPLFDAHGADTNAEFRVGRLYYDVDTLSTSWLFSDNADRTETDRRSGVIGIATLKGMVLFQVLENLRIAARVGFVFLPLRGKFGIAGLVRDSSYTRLGLDENQLESLRAQLVYDLRLAYWNVSVYDYIRVRTPRINFEENFSFSGSEPFSEEDRIGRYTFRSGIGGSGGVRVNENDRLSDQNFNAIINQAGISANRLIPTDTRIELGAYRMNYWYIGDGGAINLPTTRDVGYVSLESERENLRFKPYASYQIHRYNEQPWSHRAHAGLHGPVTDNIQVSGSVGYTFGGAANRSTLLAHARLQHELGPLTRQYFDYRRDYTEPEEDLEESYSYHLNQTINAYLTADAFATYATFTDLNNNNTGSTEWRAGLIFHSEFSSRTFFRFGAVYAHVKNANPALGEWNRWTTLAQIHHRFSKSITATLTHRYQTRDSSIGGNSYDENVVSLTLTKQFNAPQRGVDVTEE